MPRKLNQERFYAEYIHGRWLEVHGYRFHAKRLIEELTHAGYGTHTPRGIHFHTEPSPAELNRMMRDHGLLPPKEFMKLYKGINPHRRKFRVALILALLYAFSVALVLEYSGAHRIALRASNAVLELFTE